MPGFARADGVHGNTNWSWEARSVNGRNLELRLRAHLAAANELIESSQPVGRKFEFLAQEFNREANTICSKASDIEISRTGIELKTVIDQLREQVQNIE